MTSSLPSAPAPAFLTARAGDTCRLCGMHPMGKIVNRATHEAVTGIMACPHCDHTACPGIKNCRACVNVANKTYPGLNWPPPTTGSNPT